MVAHKYPEHEGVHSSPANVQHYQSHGHGCNNPHLSLPSHAETDRLHMMSDAPHTTVPLLFDNMMKTYLPPVDQDSFDAVYSTEKITRIHKAFTTAVSLSSGKKDDHTKEKIVSQAWHDVHKEMLSSSYLLNISETKADGTDTKKYRIDGALISKADKDLIEESHLNYMLSDLGIEFKCSGTEDDTWNNHANKNMEADADKWTGVRGQLMSYSERFFFFQHRTGLFMLLDRSGYIVTEVLNYIDTPEHTKKLLQFLYSFSKATPVQRGVDPTATHLSKDSCGWKWMQKVAVAHPQDIDHADGTIVPSVPPGFIVNPTCNAPPSSLFATNILTDNPAATTNFGDLSLSSAMSTIKPVFKYVCNFFQESICDCDYLVSKPIFAPHGLVGRGTRGYVILEWQTQCLIFLKDAWCPFYEGVAQEGTTLGDLNDATVSFDIGGLGAQETEASHDRHVALMPSSRSKISGSNGSTTSQTPPSSGSSNGTPQTQTSSGSNRNQSTHAYTSQSSSGQKCPLPQDTAPIVPRDGSGLRHLTHYRIIITEVCLPSMEIKSSHQLMQIVLNCMIGHRDATVKCGILHRDVSSGNILIRPEVYCVNRETGENMVLWYGVLSDWDLAKALPVEGKAIVKAHQPHHTGIWYYMSVYSLTYPGLPVSITNELESFLHVIIYLAAHFLWTSFLNVGSFVDDYFEAAGREFDNRVTCGLLKQMVIHNGSLQQDKPEHLSPLNDVIQMYLAYFKACYAVLEYEHQMSEERAKPLPSLQSAIKAIATSSSMAATRASQAIGLPVESNDSDSEDPVLTRSDLRLAKQPEKPPQAVCEMAAKLTTHDAIIRMLAKAVRTRVWPTDDYAGDQLVGYIPFWLQSTVKRARLELRSALQSIPEGQEPLHRPHTMA
ncbi:hypothetical protein V8D89_010980 [Ganoderma adspersum]